MTERGNSQLLQVSWMKLPLTFFLFHIFDEFGFTF